MEKVIEVEKKVLEKNKHYQHLLNEQNQLLSQIKSLLPPNQHNLIIKLSDNIDYMNALSWGIILKRNTK